MGMMKNYLLKVLEQCSEENFGQDAVEWAIVSGRVHLSYELDRDIREIMLKYDDIIDAYRLSLAGAPEKLSRAHAPMRRAVPRRAKSDRASRTSTDRRRAA